MSAVSADTTGKSPADILRTPMLRCAMALKSTAIYDAIDALDNQVPGDVQNQFYHLVGEDVAGHHGLGAAQ